MIQNQNWGYSFLMGGNCTESALISAGWDAGVVCFWSTVYGDPAFGFAPVASILFGWVIVAVTSFGSEYIWSKWEKPKLYMRSWERSMDVMKNTCTNIGVQSSCMVTIRVWEYRIEYRPDTYLDTFFVSFHCIWEQCICIGKVSIEMHRRYDTFLLYAACIFDYCEGERI